MLRPYKRGGRSRPRSETGLGEGDGEAAVGDIVGGLHGALGGERDETILKTLFGGEVDGRRFAGEDGGDRFGVFGGGEFAREPQCWRGACPARGRPKGRPYARTVQRENGIALFAEGDFEDARGVVENAEDADDRRGVNGFAESLVVETNVAAGDGCAECVAGFSDAIDGFAELPHYFGLFRAAEVEAIRGGDGPRAGACNVAGGFGDCVHGADARIQLTPAAIAVGGERERALHYARLRILDAHHGGIASARAGQSVCPHRSVVLLGDPAL